VRTEDDLLHIRPLPDFDGTLSQRDSELLLSYLTAPYVRVPLILAFFASAAHVNALGSKTLRSVVDGVLFEPGRWQADVHREVPPEIPAPDRAHLATPCGLLFNELQVGHKRTNEMHVYNRLRNTHTHAREHANSSAHARTFFSSRRPPS
jgi:hypothetical protein